MEALRNPIEAATRFQNVLQAAGLESMVIGGLAVAVWGEPRATRGADIKLRLTRNDRSRLLAAMPADSYEIPSESDELLQRFGFLFIRDTDGIRIDLLLSETAFDLEAVGRNQTVEVLPGLTPRICAPEDLIIYKMISTRARDHADVPGIILRQRGKLDNLYVERWLRQFELALDDSTLVNSFKRMQTAVELGQELHPDL